MTFNKGTLKTIAAALLAAVGWEESLAEAYDHVNGSPERVKALRAAKRYAKLRARIVQAISMDSTKEGA